MSPHDKIKIIRLKKIYQISKAKLLHTIISILTNHNRGSMKYHCWVSQLDKYSDAVLLCGVCVVLVAILLLCYCFSHSFKLFVVLCWHYIYSEGKAWCVLRVGTGPRCMENGHHCLLCCSCWLGASITPQTAYAWCMHYSHTPPRTDEKAMDDDVMHCTMTCLTNKVVLYDLACANGDVLAVYAVWNLWS